MQTIWAMFLLGGSLLFDGASTYVAYDAKELCVSGNALTISVWVAPRAFEWDDPNAASSGNAHVTAIVGQYYQPGNQGFLLGYQRFGRLCFHVGTEDDWFTLWAKDGQLIKEIFIDRSLVEGCFNADQAISVRSCADPTAQEIRLFGDGEVQVLERRVFAVSSIYQ